MLPVPEPFAPVLPREGLQRGTTLVTSGPAAVSLALGLVAAVTTSGSWVAVVGLSDLGLVAAAELGVDLERILLVAEPGPDSWPTVVAALLDAVEVVLLRPPGPLAATTHRRLLSRARERGSVLVQVGGEVGSWPTAPDLTMSSSDPRWTGLEAGHGHLMARQVAVSVAGRRGAVRPRRTRLWLPAPGGGVSAVAEAVSPAPVVSTSGLRALA